MLNGFVLNGFVANGFAGEGFVEKAFDAVAPEFKKFSVDNGEIFVDSRELLLISFEVTVSP